MSFSKAPHTVATFFRGGRIQSLGRPGHLSATQVGEILASRGVAGPVTIRHHEAAMFGKPGKQVRVVAHRVGP